MTQPEQTLRDAAAVLREHPDLMPPALAGLAAVWLERIAWSWHIDPGLQHRIGGDEALAFAVAVLEASSTKPAPSIE